MTTKLTEVVNIVAIAGFGLSLYNFLKDLYRNRKKLHVEIQATYTWANVIVARFMFVNKSLSPISIYKVSVKHKIYNFEFQTMPIRLLGEVKDLQGVVLDKPLYSYKFPVFLQGSEGTSVLCTARKIDNPQAIQEEQVKITLYTSRGVIKTKLTFPNFSNSKQLMLSIR